MANKAQGNGSAALAGERDPVTQEAPDGRLGLGALASAWFQFTSLADELTDCPH
jgi:hypothetical protein